MSFFHTAFELEGNRLEDVARLCRAVEGGRLSRAITDRCATTASRRSATAKPAATSPRYFYDPDYNNVEFCGAMDTIENYRARYGDTKGSTRT